MNTVEDFATMLVRWVVDVYHNTPHEGLGGETPFECWERLANIYGVRPGPDLRTQRIAFGVSLKRKLDKAGITILGVAYSFAMDLPETCFAAALAGGLAWRSISEAAAARASRRRHRISWRRQ